MKIKKDKVILELENIAKLYNGSSLLEAKECYDQYVQIVINNEVPRVTQQEYLQYWEGLKFKSEK